MKIDLGFLEDDDGDVLPIMEVDGELVEGLDVMKPCPLCLDDPAPSCRSCGGTGLVPEQREGPEDGCETSAP